MTSSDFRMRYFAKEYDINTINVDEINSKIENVMDSYVNWVGTLDRSRYPRASTEIVYSGRSKGVFLNVLGPGWFRVRGSLDRRRSRRDDGTLYVGDMGIIFLVLSVPKMFNNQKCLVRVSIIIIYITGI